MLILSDYIEKHEFTPLRKHLKIEDLIGGANKIIKGLGREINPSRHYKNYRFFKVRIGTTSKGRMIVFVLTQNKKIVPILIRLKKDKKTGMNMSASNPDVIKEVEKNLQHVVNDIENGFFKEF